MNQRPIDELFNKIKGKKVVVFGYGRRGRAIERHFPCKVDYFVDNDPAKWGQGQSGHVVRSFDVLASEDRASLFVIVVSYYYKPICWQLEESGFIEGDNFTDGLAYLGDALNPEVINNPISYDPRKVWLRGNPRVEGNCKFDGHNVILDETHLIDSSLGRYSTIGKRCSLRNTAVGQFCSIGSEVMLGLEGHPTRGAVSTYGSFYIGKPTGIPAFAKEELFKQGLTVTVGNDVWIGSRAIVLGGIRIGDGAVIGAGAVVTRDVKPYSIVAGTPAKVIRQRFSDAEIEKLANLAWWNQSIDWIRGHAHLFLVSNEFFDYFGK